MIENTSRPRVLSSITLGSALLVSWSVAISGGYKVPAFFATPLLFSASMVHLAMSGKYKFYLAFVLLSGLIAFGVGYQYPYVFPARPLARADMTYDAGSLYSKANFVYVDQDMYERLRELKLLREKYGPKYKALPGFCLAYYLNDDYPVYGSDWLIDWEINAETETLYQELLDKQLTVFMEKDQLMTTQADGYARSGYTVPQRVRKKWQKIEETNHFVVFRFAK